MTTCHDQYDPPPPVQHPAATVELAVTRPQRSARFYEQRLGFEPGAANAETVSVRNPGGGVVSFRQAAEGYTGRGVHLGFRRTQRAEVVGLHERLTRDAVGLFDYEERPDLVTVKVRDPDGYVVEIYWQP